MFVRALRWLLLVLCLAGCGTEAPEVCAEQVCEQGHCEALEGAPVCVCRDAMDVGCGGMAGALPVQPTDAPVEGTLESGATVLRLAFTALPEHSYRFACDRGTLPGCSVGVLTAQGQLLGEPAPGTRSLLLKHWSLRGGTFLLEVSFPGAQGGGTFTYHLEDLGKDDAGDAPWSAVARTPDGEWFAGRMDAPGDGDVYAFTTVPGHVYRFTCRQPFDAPGRWGEVRLFNTRGEQADILGGGRPSSNTVTVWATAPEPETWFARVSFPDVLVGVQYDCALVDFGADDHGDIPGTATAFTPSAEGIEGSTQWVEDSDVFSTPLLAGHYYRVECRPGTRRGCHVIVRDPSGAVMSGGSSSDGYVFSAAPAGTFTFLVRGEGDLGTYTLHLTDMGVEDDHGGTPQAASVLDASGEVRGRLEFSFDTDVFSFIAQAGSIYRISCETAPSSGHVTVEDPAGNHLYPRALGSSPGEHFVEVVTAGPHTLRVGSANISPPPLPGPYACRLENLGLDDHGDTRSVATALAAGADVRGELEMPVDVDVFSFRATPGHVYRATCSQGTPQNRCSHTFTNAVGTSVASSAALSSSISFEAPSEGPWFIEVFSGVSSWGAYSLRLEDLGPEDHGDTPARATAITLGTVSGLHHDAQDVDVFAFAATQDLHYRVTCTNNCGLRFQAPSGAVGIAFVSGGGASSVYTLDVRVTGTLYIQTSGSSGAYTLQVEELERDDYGDTSASAAPLELGVEKQGRIEVGADVDFFSIPLEAERASQLVLRSDSSISWRILAPNGNIVPRAPDGSFKSTTAGTYFIQVQLGFSGSASASYALRMQ